MLYINCIIIFITLDKWCVMCIGANAHTHTDHIIFGKFHAFHSLKLESIFGWFRSVGHLTFLVEQLLYMSLAIVVITTAK